MRYLIAIIIAFTIVLAPSNIEAKTINREQRDSLFGHKIDSLILSRQWIFHPVTIENVELGSTYDVYSYNLFLRLNQERAAIHLPMEFTSLVIFTNNIDSTIDNYSVFALDDVLRRIAFTLYYNNTEWVVEALVSNRTSETIVAITTDKGIMRYLGSIGPITPKEP